MTAPVARPVGCGAEHLAATLAHSVGLAADDGVAVLAHPASRPAPAPLGLDEGWVHADLDGRDADDFARLLDVLARPHRAEAVAMAAQEWRLPVVPYRRRTPYAGAVRRPATVGDGPARACRHLGRSPRVLELTTLWAGPLAGHLLARHLGATVRRVVPSRRPDAAGYADLNVGKEVVDVDATDPAGRAEVLALAAAADVVVSNFSRRVLPNLGLDPGVLAAVNPGAVVVTIPAFPAGSAEADWVAFGSGVHAAAGLADRGDGTFAPAPYSYPDPLAGLTAFVAVVRRLAAGHPGHVEVSLRAAVEPLVRGWAP